LDYQARTAYKWYLAELQNCFLWIQIAKKFSFILAFDNAPDLLLYLKDILSVLLKVKKCLAGHSSNYRSLLIL